ncbi:MAG: amidophosphoribosyltransferase [Elusimicrobiota bacterium]
MCGVFGVFNQPEAAKLAYLGLYSLQHRGQESAGIASSNGEKIHSIIKMGQVADVFDQPSLESLKGNAAIGHVRYSTTGVSQLKNAQPLVINYKKGQLALAHNGNLINAGHLRAKLESDGSIFQTTSDSEVILHLIARANGRPIEKALEYALSKVRGAYSLVMMSETQLIAARDPWGVRPLVLGKIKKGWVVASETCALDLIGAEYIREIEPGEMVVIDKKGARPVKFAEKKRDAAMCIFEYIYFSRPDSIIFGKSVHAVRQQLGKHLALESMPKIKDADLVFSVPDSANSAAIGFSRASGVPFETGLIRNHYVGRTFIEPSQHIRDFGAKIKYNPVRDILKGKDVVVVDDSIVRGTTSRKLVKMIRSAGVRKIHMVVSSPPIIASCFYGIDTPTKKELIASNYSVEGIRKFIGADTLNYLSVEGMIAATGAAGFKFCTACFTDKYKITDKC